MKNYVEIKRLDIPLFAINEEKANKALKDMLEMLGLESTINKIQIRTYFDKVGSVDRMKVDIFPDGEPLKTFDFKEDELFASELDRSYACYQNQLIREKLHEEKADYIRIVCGIKKDFSLEGVKIFSYKIID